MAAYFCIYFTLAVLTAGAATPGGLIVPFIILGGIMGRLSALLFTELLDTFSTPSSNPSWLYSAWQGPAHELHGEHVLRQLRPHSKINNSSLLVYLDRIVLKGDFVTGFDLIDYGGFRYFATCSPFKSPPRCRTPEHTRSPALRRSWQRQAGSRFSSPS
eukprot:scaffold153270_cov42-Prasinocladus_malaysianus.AAC.1